MSQEGRGRRLNSTTDCDGCGKRLGDHVPDGTVELDLSRLGHGTVYHDGRVELVCRSCAKLSRLA
jgi:hypothetical protein